MEEDKVSVSKPGYDGRQQTVIVIREYLLKIADSQVQNDIITWHRLMIGLFGLTNGYIQHEPKEKLMNLKKRIDNAILIWQNSGSRDLLPNLNSKLLDFNFLLMDAIKHILLPINSEEDEDLDMENFLKSHVNL